MGAWRTGHAQFANGNRGRQCNRGRRSPISRAYSGLHLGQPDLRRFDGIQPAAGIPPGHRQRSLSGSPVDSPANMASMLECCARHQILPQVELFPMSRINDAIDHLHAGKARYRVVLDASQ